MVPTDPDSRPGVAATLTGTPGTAGRPATPPTPTPPRAVTVQVKAALPSAALGRYTHTNNQVWREKERKEKKPIQPLVWAVVSYRGSSGDHSRMVMSCGCRILSLQCACLQLCERAVLRRHVWRGKKEGGEEKKRERKEATLWQQRRSLPEGGDNANRILSLQCACLQL